jgi:hypothetical protein
VWERRLKKDRLHGRADAGLDQGSRVSDWRFHALQQSSQ